MTKEEYFDEKAKVLAETKRTEDAKAQCKYDFVFGCEIGYQYAKEKFLKLVDEVLCNVEADVCITKAQRDFIIKAMEDNQ